MAQAITHLWSITGNIDVPGGNVIARPSHGVTTYPYTTEELVGLYGQDLVDKLNAKRIGADRYPMVKGFRGWAHPDVAIDQIASGRSLSHQGRLDPDLQHHRRPGGPSRSFTTRP